MPKTDREEIESSQDKTSNLQKHKHASLIQVIFLGVLFLFCRTTFVSYSNMVSEIYHQEGYNYLGTLSVIGVWVGFGIINLFFAQNILQKISFKAALMICSLNFPIVTVTGLYGSACEGSDSNLCHPALVYFVVILCSLVCGSMGSVLWMSQAGYLIQSAPPEKLAFYIGIFFALNQSCQITANLLSLFALGHVSHFYYFLILFCIALLFSFLFIVIPPVDKPKKKELTIKENLIKIMSIMKQTKSQLLSVYFTTIGVCIGFYSGYLFQLVQDCLESGLSRSEVNVMTSYVFLLLGVCSFFAGLICGKLAGKIPLGRLMMFSIVLLEASIIASMFTFYTKNYCLCFIAGGLWGFTDSFITTLSNIIVRIEYGGGLEGYVILRFFMCVGCFVTCLLSIVLLHHPTIFLLIIFIQQVIAMVVVLEIKI